MTLWGKQILEETVSFTHDEDLKLITISSRCSWQIIILM